MKYKSLRTLNCSKMSVRPARRTHRKAAVIVEVAIVCPLVFLLIIGICVCGIASFRKHQVTTLACEGARWAAINAKTYANKNKGSMPSSKEIYDKAIKPLAASLDPEKLKYNVVWDQTNQTVSVTVDYQTVPRFLGKSFLAHSEMTCNIIQ